ncbi:hypothetical protein GUJ93_ZPchr0008g12611 [Zizania palustris]|uniref:DUF7851 domain-containing protein n=1 Tax=Zizania palustris TaxID=103762 RepID=A0A8J5RKD6_ZIZPA|nr:hypothetical protein GUJ93_ZPchr0008g12611 [Zizania palustris]
MKATMDQLWLAMIPLGDVNKKIIHGLIGSDMAQSSSGWAASPYMSTPSIGSAPLASCVPTTSGGYFSRWFISSIYWITLSCSTCQA